MFVLNHDKTKSIYVAGASSKTAREIISKHQIIDKVDESLILLSNNKIFLYSDAVIKVSTLMRGIYMGLVLLKIIPKPIRDFFYKLIAKRRKNILSKSCEISQETENHERILN